MRNEQPAGNSVAFPDEILHLEEISVRLKDALKEAERGVEQLDREYRDAKRYMVEYRGEIDPHEMFQNELLLKQADRTGASAVVRRDRLAKLMDSPYFARIDFRCREDDLPEVYYIGRFAFAHQDELLIFDWRSPVASMFYDCDVGPAGYDAPIGRIDGELTRKRQFKIKNSVMQYALESSSHVQDELLQQELSHTSDEKMKSIIATIQKEQNKIIRSERTGTLIIQGVAGSGKTSIALHRIAFLLYRFQDRLNARNITILSPNKVFGDYIGGVIPELGEEPVYQMNLTELAEIELENVVEFEPNKDPLEEQDTAWADRTRFKSTLEFVRQMDSYIDSLPNRVFQPVDIAFGRFTASGAWILERFLTYAGNPIKQRLPKVADDVLNRFQTENSRQDELPKAREILKCLTAMLSVRSTLALYRDFYRSIGRPQLFVQPASKTLEWADVYPFLYLHTAFSGAKQSSVTRHLVIDEMQDYSPIQYAVLNRLFCCDKTILGDFGQVLNPCHAHTLQDLRSLYGGAEYVSLTKSYRSTYEILRFSERIQSITGLEPVERHGPEPDLISCKTHAELLQKLSKAIQAFQQGSNSSLGIIVKSNDDARRLYHELSGVTVLNLISPESTRFTSGVSVASVQMAKGLEFDEVILPQASDQEYCSDFHRSLLYVSCTRAMHRLTLLYTGKLSRFLTQDNKRLLK